jgi:hypothetical protein
VNSGTTTSTKPIAGIAAETESCEPPAGFLRSGVLLQHNSGQRRALSLSACRTVEQRRYRFRVLNGSQARFYNLQLNYADSTGNEADLGKPGPEFIPLGTEGGFLPAPVLLNAPPARD